MNLFVAFLYPEGNKIKERGRINQKNEFKEIKTVIKT